ncbi:unnamed protein product [Staurois parvus]|uniref:Uncharacterized protein n=1 Tax=Staurois parvus TaxID=386267 RepID=A0ABN9GJU6_9NEOB|nr:unnamed protein product [Staurois parvus]
MRSPKKQKTSLAIYTKLSMCMPTVQSGDKRGKEKKGSNSLFTQCRGLTP